MKFRTVVSMTMLAAFAAGLAWAPATARAQTTKTHRQQTLEYISQTANFTIDEPLTGATSGATATIVVDNDSGSSGTLTLTNLLPGTGAVFFLDGEAITDGGGGSAVANGVVSYRGLQCAFCHTLHGSPGGTLNTGDTFENTCLTCHGPVASPPPGAATNITSHTNETCIRNCAERPFYLGCDTCHLPHGNLENRLYVGSGEHDHVHADDGANCQSDGGLVRCDGVNRKLVGTEYDGTRIAKIATPITVYSSGPVAPSWTGGVATVTLKFNNLFITDPPPHTIMAGDRITVRDVWSANNATGTFGLGFNGNFIVESATSWDGNLEAAISYKLATDPGAYMDNDLTKGADPNSGMVQSTGWPDRPRVGNASWTSGTATLGLGGEHSIEAGDDIAVTGAESAGNPTGSFNSGFNGIFTVTGVSGKDVTYTLATDPGAFQESPGRVEYLGSIKVIQSASTGGVAPTVRIYRTHAVQTGDIVTVFKDDPDPATFNAKNSVRRFQVTAVTPVGGDPDRDDIELSCPPLTQGINDCGLSYSLIDFTGGILQSSGTLRPVVFESRGTQWGEDATHTFATHESELASVEMLQGPCELCHTRLANNHANSNYTQTDTHHGGEGCSLSCHTHAKAAGAFFR